MCRGRGRSRSVEEEEEDAKNGFECRRAVGSEEGGRGARSRRAAGRKSKRERKKG